MFSKRQNSNTYGYMDDTGKNIFDDSPNQNYFNFQCTNFFSHHLSSKSSDFNENQANKNANENDLMDFLNLKLKSRCSRRSYISRRKRKSFDFSYDQNELLKKNKIAPISTNPSNDFYANYHSNSATVFLRNGSNYILKSDIKHKNIPHVTTTTNTSINNNANSNNTSNISNVRMNSGDNLILKYYANNHTFYRTSSNITNPNSNNGDNLVFGLCDIDSVAGDESDSEDNAVNNKVSESDEDGNVSEDEFITNQSGAGFNLQFIKGGANNKKMYMKSKVNNNSKECDNEKESVGDGKKNNENDNEEGENNNNNSEEKSVEHDEGFFLKKNLKNDNNKKHSLDDIGGDNTYSSGNKLNSIVSGKSFKEDDKEMINTNNIANTNNVNSFKYIFNNSSSKSNQSPELQPQTKKSSHKFNNVSNSPLLQQFNPNSNVQPLQQQQQQPSTSSSSTYLHYKPQQQPNPYLHIPPTSPSSLPPASPLSSSYQRNQELFSKTHSLIQDQAGCRFLQKKIDEDPSISNTLFTILYPDLITLCTDSFGNYLIQKILDNLSMDNISKFTSFLSSKFTFIAMSTYGTRVIQKLLDILCASLYTNPTTSSSFYQLNNLIISNLVNITSDSNSSHIIIKCVNTIKYPHNTSLFEAIAKQFISLSKDKHGCCIVQKAIEASNPQQKEMFLTLCNINCEELINDQFGNYVIQSVINLNVDKVNDYFVELITTNGRYLCKEKYASNVIEKFLAHKNNASRKLIEYIMNNEDVLSELLFDNYGNYIVQRVLTLIGQDERMKIIQYIIEWLPKVKSLPFGERLIAKLSERYNEFNLMLRQKYANGTANVRSGFVQQQQQQQQQPQTMFGNVQGMNFGLMRGRRFQPVNVNINAVAAQQQQHSQFRFDGGNQVGLGMGYQHQLPQQQQQQQHMYGMPFYNQNAFNNGVNVNLPNTNQMFINSRGMY